ncbi:MAG: carbohydrate ABC transporter permease [Chloroflexales bacterium]|nr:carbohydrate ABC transporter permease [Chloroflexales bacterium]
MATLTATPARWRVRPGRLLRGALFYAALALFLVVVLLPIYYVLTGAFVQGDRLFTKPLTYLPTNLSLDRFRLVFRELPLWRYLWNTFFLATGSTLIALALCFLAAYSIARFQFPGANAVLLVLLVSSMLPATSTVIPLFQLWRDLKLMNTLHGLLILYVSALLPTTTWVLISFIRQLPTEVEDAAKVDGAGFWQLIWFVIVPMLRPGLATMFVINFITGWNEFFTPLVFARGPASKVIGMALTEAQTISSSSQFVQNWGNTAAVAIIMTIPVFLITLAFQRQIVAGLASGVYK